MKLDTIGQAVGRTNRKFSAANSIRVGSQPPNGYVAWHEWAAAQHRGGLRQKQCKVCGLWKFPQETWGLTECSRPLSSPGTTVNQRREAMNQQKRLTDEELDKLLIEQGMDEWITAALLELKELRNRLADNQRGEQ